MAIQKCKRQIWIAYRVKGCVLMAVLPPRQFAAVVHGNVSDTQYDRGMETELEAYAHVNPASAKYKQYRESQDKEIK